MIFINTICPVCNNHSLGSQSNSKKHKKYFKTCGSKECAQLLRGINHKTGAKFTRSIHLYNGTDLCACGNNAQYQFKSGKICCQSVASNCPVTRAELNKRIATKLKNTVDADGLTGTQRKANKAANTKRITIDEFGRNGYDRFNENFKKSLAASIDEYGRSYISRGMQSLEEFLLKPEKERYHALVWALTEQQFKYNKLNILNYSMRSTTYHLDHIYSISEGFKQNIPAEVIAHYTNLRVIPAVLNCSKGSDCHKSIDQLYTDFELARTSSNDISL